MLEHDARQFWNPNITDLQRLFFPSFGEVLHTEMPKRRWQRMFLSCVNGVYTLNGSKINLFLWLPSWGSSNGECIPFVLKSSVPNKNDDHPIDLYNLWRNTQLLQTKPLEFAGTIFSDTPIWSFSNLSRMALYGVIVHGWYRHFHQSTIQDSLLWRSRKGCQNELSHGMLIIGVNSVWPLQPCYLLEFHESWRDLSWPPLVQLELN